MSRTTVICVEIWQECMGELARQWLNYMEHLKSNYSHLFSLALRTNPFNRSASPVVRGS